MEQVNSKPSFVEFVNDNVFRGKCLLLPAFFVVVFGGVIVEPISSDASILIEVISRLVAFLISVVLLPFALVGALFGLPCAAVAYWGLTHSQDEITGTV